jgi:hypothetical protein
MNKNELVASLNSSRQRLIDAMNDLTDLELIETGSDGGWSVKDIIAHLAAWEAELVTALARDVAQNKPPRLKGISDAEVEKLNGQWYTENKDRPLDRVREDFAGARKQLLRQVGGLNDKDLTDPKKYKWLDGKTLADYIADYANGHDDEHVAGLQNWRADHA